MSTKVDRDRSRRSEGAHVIPDGNTYRMWQTRNRNIGCIFARIIAKDPSKYGIITTTIYDKISIENIRAVAAACVDITQRAVKYPQAQTLGLLLPGLSEPRLLASLCHALAKYDGWMLEMETGFHDEMEWHFAQLKCHVGEVNDRAVYAEILGFAPFAFLPKTRQAPVTALELRCKPSGSLDPPDGLSASYRQVHLAAVPLPGWKDTARDRIWKRTKRERLRVLGCNDPRARARVTFAVPTSIWKWDEHDHEGKQE